MFFIVLFLVGFTVGSAVVHESFLINTTIYNHFSTSFVESKYMNNGPEMSNVAFLLVIPPDAYILGNTFRLITDYGKIFKGYVLEKKLAEHLYEKSNLSSSLISLTGPNVYSFEAKILPFSNVTFQVEFQELLARRSTFYTCDTFIQTKTVIQDLRYEYWIHEDYGFESFSLPSDAIMTSLGPKDKRIVIQNPTYESGKLMKKTVKYQVKDSQIPKEGEFYLRGRYFAHLVNPDIWRDDPSALGLAVIFVIDTSGSMMSEIGRVKESFQNMISQLKPTDRFSVAEFSTASRTWKSELVYATDGNKAAANSWVGNLQATGATNIHAGLVDGLDILNSGIGSSNEIVGMIILLSDGEHNYGFPVEQLREDINSKNVNRYLIHSIGYGLYNYALLEGLSVDSDGYSITVVPELNVDEQLGSFFSQIDTVLYRNVELSYKIVNTNGVSISKTSKKVFKSYFNGSEIVVSGKLQYHKVHDDFVKFMINMTAETTSGSINLGILKNLSINKNNVSDGVPTKRIYQNQKIQEYVLEYVTAKDEGSSTSAYVTALAFALWYQIVTPVTSLLVREYNFTKDSSLWMNEDGGGRYYDDVEYSFGVRRSGGVVFVLLMVLVGVLNG